MQLVSSAVASSSELAPMGHFPFNLTQVHKKRDLLKHQCQTPLLYHAGVSQVRQSYMNYIKAVVLVHQPLYSREALLSTAWCWVPLHTEAVKPHSDSY